MFSPLVFNWGEEVYVTNTNKVIRNGLAWTVVVGLIVSIVGGFIVNRLN